MTAQRIECTSCHKSVANDSAFCRHCGSKILRLPAERESILAQTGDFFPSGNEGAALKAIRVYLDQWSDSPEARDVLFARQCIGLLVQLERLPRIDFFDAMFDGSEAKFEDSLEFVIGEVAETLGERTRGEHFERLELQRQTALDEIDPEAARKLYEELYGPAIAKLQRVFEEKSVDGKGVPLGRVMWHGEWECTMTGPAWRVTLRFEAQKLPQSPFAGRFMAKGTTEIDEEIRGTWMPIIDNENKLLLGMFLDGHKSGIEFKVRLPFDRQMGEDLIGKDENGFTYVSRNLTDSPVARPLKLSSRFVVGFAEKTSMEHRKPSYIQSSHNGFGTVAG